MTDTVNRTIRVLFVCLGNICRSPMAEAVFHHKVQQCGLGKTIEVDSAGTGDWHAGSPPHVGTLRILAKNGIPVNHRRRVFTRHDLQAFDYVIAMDNMNLRDIQALGPGAAHVARLMDYAPGAGRSEVPDPFYDGGFEEVYRLVDRATTGLLEAIRRDHQV